MSTSANGRLADEDDDPWADFTVEVHDAQSLFDSKLGSATSDADGEFRLSYPGHGSDLFGPRRLEVRVYDKVRRVLHRAEMADTDDAQLALDPIQIRRADAEGLLVTLGVRGQRRRLARAGGRRPDRRLAWSPCIRVPTSLRRRGR